MNSLIALWQDMTTMELVITLLIASNMLAWIKIGLLSGKYHRLDALQYGTAKAIQAAFPHIKLINESADGDGNYSLDRSQCGLSETFIYRIHVKNLGRWR